MNHHASVKMNPPSDFKGGKDEENQQMAEPNESTFGLCHTEWK